MLGCVRPKSTGKRLTVQTVPSAWSHFVVRIWRAIVEHEIVQDDFGDQPIYVIYIIREHLVVVFVDLVVGIWL